MDGEAKTRHDEPISYMDFDLEIGKGDGGTYPVKILHAKGGETNGSLHLPYDDRQLERCLLSLENIILRSSGTRRQALTTEEQSVREFGKALFDALFDDDIRSDYFYSYNFARQQQKGLRIKMRILPPELAALPWEFLFDSRRNDYVCLSRYTPVVRYLPLNLAIEPFEVTLPLKILVMDANPNDLPVLQFNEEKERLFESLRPLSDQKLAEIHLLPGETWRDLQDAMLGGPWHIFHYIGHGGFDTKTDEGYIVLTDERRGGMRQLSATKLARLLADHPSLRLAFLNSCEGGKGSLRDVYSSTAATLVSHGIPAALGMQYAISDQAAVEFTLSFYDKIARGFPVDAAVTEARKSVSLAQEQTVEWVTPVLFMHVADGVLFRLVEKPTDQRLREEAERLRREQSQREEQRGEIERKAREEKERLEKEKAAREETERLALATAAREEAERKARAEAERKSRELAAQEEADRKQREDEVRLARERFIREEAEQKEREKAEGQRREEERLAREKAAREEAERKAREERKAKARQEAEKAAREKAALDELNRQVASLVSQLSRAEADADWNTAIGVGRQIMTLVVDHPSATSRTAQAYISRAADYRDKQRYKEAITDINKAIELEPNKVSYTAERANVYFLKGDYDKAIEDYNHAIKRDPQNGQYFQGRGKCYFQKEDYTKALADLTSAISKEPTKAVYYANRSACYGRQNDIKLAVTDLTKAIELNPQEADYYYWRAWYLHDLGSYQKGIDDCTQAIKLNDKNADYYHLRGLCRDALSSKQAKAKTGTATFLTGTGLGSSYKPGSLSTRFTKKVDQDFSFLKPYQKKTPALSSPSSLRADTFNFDLALLDFSKAIELAPKAAFYYAARGVHYHNQGTYDLSIKDFTTAINLAPQEGEYYYRRGFTYSVLHNKDRISISRVSLSKGLYRGLAVSDLEKAISLGYSQAKSLLDKIKSNPFA